MMIDPDVSVFIDAIYATGGMPAICDSHDPDPRANEVSEMRPANSLDISDGLFVVGSPMDDTKAARSNGVEDR